MAKDPRGALIRSAAAAVRKEFKDGIADVGTRALEFPSVWASTGSLALDRLCTGMNPGGIPMGPRMGRIIHIAGLWSTGKSVILDHIFKSVLVDLKGLAVCSETEGTRDPHFANAIGLPLDMLMVQRPGTFEEAFDMFAEFHDDVRKQDEEIPIVWGFDSLDSTESEKSSDKGLSEGGGWHFGGGRAEVLGAGLRRMAKMTSRYPTTLVMLNQTRDNVGVMFGPKQRTPGGNPPHFYASLEIMLSHSYRPGGGLIRTKNALPKLTGPSLKRLGLQYSADAGAVVGRYVRAKITKSKVATTYDTSGDFYIDFRRGLHKWEGLSERLMFEGLLKCGSDGASDFLMAGAMAADGEVFETKREWLNWIAQNLDVLRYGPLAEIPSQDTGGEVDIAEAAPEEDVKA